MDLDSITAANQRNSPLLRLPAELRNKIYLYAFDNNRVWLARNRRVLQGPYQPSPYPMGLAHSCTQCRHEALPYFWRSTVFHLMYASMRALVDDTSQSMRDQVEVVRPDSGIAWRLQRSKGGSREGVFSRVQKVIMVYRRPPGVTKDAFTEVMRETYGGDAELVDAYGKRYVWDH